MVHAVGMKIHTQPDQLGGVWANAAAVRHSPHEFTIDFLRCEFDDVGKAKQGLLVQRVNMSPLFVSQLISALQENWSKYASKAMPHDLLESFDTSVEPGADETSDDEPTDAAADEASDEVADDGGTEPGGAPDDGPTA